MNEVFWLILSLSLSGTILILLLLVTKPLYRNRLSRSWQYYIWIVVIARMLLPFSQEDSIMGAALSRVDNAIASVQSGAQDSYVSAESSAPSQGYNSTDHSAPQGYSSTDSSAPQGYSSEDSYTTSRSYILEDSSASARNSAAFNGTAAAQRLKISSIFKLLLLLYTCVAILLLLKKAVIYRHFVHFVKTGMIKIQDTRILHLLSEARCQAGVKTNVSLYTNSAVTSPMTIGLCHPFLIIPATDINTEELRCILLHELTHIRRLDILYKWVVQLTICLHWFNPLIYLMEKEINNNCELSCDEVIVRNSDPHSRKVYGDTLLHSLAYAGKLKDNYASLHLSKNAEQIKERLGAIMKYKKKTTAITVLTTIITVCVCVGSYVTGAYAAHNPAPSTEEEPQNVWEAMARRGETYTYSQTGYYQYPYIFDLGWNLNESGQKYYPDQTRITLTDHSAMTVFLTRECREYVKDKNVITALTQLIERLKADYTDSFIPLESPVVVSLEYVGDRKVGELAEEYYENGSLTAFTAIFTALDSDTQLVYCDRMIQDNSIAYFSSCLRRMTPEIVSVCAEKTYLTDNSFFFHNIVPYLTEEEIDEYLKRAEEDDKVNSFRVFLQEEKEIINTFEVLKTALKEEMDRLHQKASAGKTEPSRQKTAQNDVENSNQPSLQDEEKPEVQKQIIAQKEAQLEYLKEALKEETERIRQKIQTEEKNLTASQKEEQEKDTAYSKQLEEKMNDLQEEIDRLGSPEAAIREILENANIDTSILENLRQSNRLESLKIYFQRELERLENGVL